jgi:hypothetical protein
MRAGERILSFFFLREESVSYPVQPPSRPVPRNRTLNGMDTFGKEARAIAREITLFRFNSLQLQWHVLPGEPSSTVLKIQLLPFCLYLHERYYVGATKPARRTAGCSGGRTRRACPAAGSCR